MSHAPSSLVVVCPSHDPTQLLCRDVFGVAMARGSVWNYRGHVATALRSAHEETAAAVQRTAHAHLDETPSCPHGRGGWVWIAACMEAVHVFCAQECSHVVATRDDASSRVASWVATLRCCGPSAVGDLTRATEAWGRQVAAPKRLA